MLVASVAVFLQVVAPIALEEESFKEQEVLLSRSDLCYDRLNVNDECDKYFL